ncbi:MAG: DUF3795 domain-containing protein [Saccharofermentans sp.]|nr:DUF3795 domain-containing protein [Saccharofermentans sp.]
MKRELGIARCGLACCLCSENVKCKGCRLDGFKDLSWCKDAEWCENRKCCIANNLPGCWACSESGCTKGLFKDKIKARGFAEYVRRYGMEALLDRLEINEKNGIVYHREGIMGDYDEFDDIEELISFISTGRR